LPRKTQKTQQNRQQTQKNNINNTQKHNHNVNAINENNLTISEKIINDKSNEITITPKLLNALNILSFSFLLNFKKPRFFFLFSWFLRRNLKNRTNHCLLMQGVGLACLCMERFLKIIG
jgi:hypothetical protein